MKDKTLFYNKFLAVIDRNGYIFSREVRCNGVIVSLLPFTKHNNNFRFLVRLEVCPAHGNELGRYSITGGFESKQTIETAALQELWEEAGFHAKIDELI